MLVLCCIEAKFCKKICVGKLLRRSTKCTPLHRSLITFFSLKVADNSNYFAYFSQKFANFVRILINFFGIFQKCSIYKFLKIAGKKYGEIFESSKKFESSRGKSLDFEFNSNPYLQPRYRCRGAAETSRANQKRRSNLWTRKPSRRRFSTRPRCSDR